MGRKRRGTHVRTDSLLDLVALSVSMATMDSLVDMDMLNLGTQDLDAVSSLIADANIMTHETEADLESFRVELTELQDEVNVLKNRKLQIEHDICTCDQFIERATIYTAAIAPLNPTPKAGSSKWGVLKSSILSKPEDTANELPPTSVHLPVQPEFAKFFYLATKLEMARRTSKFLGIRAKGPRSDYVEHCAELRGVIMDAVTAKVAELSEDIAIVQKVNADAVSSALSILEPPPVDRSFSSYMDIHLSSRKAPHTVPVPPPPAAPLPPPAPAPPVTAPGRHASVSFAPPPPPPPAVPKPNGATTTTSSSSSNSNNSGSRGGGTSGYGGASASPILLEQWEQKIQPGPRRRSILHDIRSTSYAAAVAKADLVSAGSDPAVAAFSAKMHHLMHALPTAQDIRACQVRNAAAFTHEAVESEDNSMYREALQAHCAETLDSFHAEMEQKMQDCLDHCKQALARHNGSLSAMKGNCCD